MIGRFYGTTARICMPADAVSKAVRSPRAYGQPGPGAYAGDPARGPAGFCADVNACVHRDSRARPDERPATQTPRQRIRKAAYRQLLVDAKAPARPGLSERRLCETSDPVRCMGTLAGLLPSAKRQEGGHDACRGSPGHGESASNARLSPPYSTGLCSRRKAWKSGCSEGGRIGSSALALSGSRWPRTVTLPDTGTHAASARAARGWAPVRAIG